MTITELLNEAYPPEFVNKIDFALPLDWVNKVKELGINPVGKFVWSYNESLMGRPLCLTEALFKIMKKEREG